MRSLRRRLLLWLLPATLLAGVLASGATYWGTLSELDELLSDQLRVIAQHVVVGDDDRPVLKGSQLSDDDRMSGTQSHGVLLQVWRAGALVFSSDADSHLPPPRGSGLSTMTLDGELWHAFVRRDGDIVVRVAQQRKARWEAVAEIAMHLFWPVLSLIPVLALFLWFGIGYGLRPLRKIVASLKRRDANNMQTIDTTATPDEVKPLVGALNDLLHRLDQAFTAQKLFIADAAHELRTPIMGLAVQADVLRRASTQEERDVTIAQIATGVSRLAHLAEQLLTLAKLAPDAPTAAVKDVDLTALARSVVSEHARTAVVVNIDLGLVGDVAVTTCGDADTLRIMMNNLVENAIRYAGAEARVDIRVGNDGGRAVLEVSDNGPGIPRADRERVWERFFRGNGNSASGSGLGLSIVKRIAEQHGAQISLKDGLDNAGLTVYIIFPEQR